MRMDASAGRDQSRFLEELQRRNLSRITTRIYLRAVEEFSRYFNQCLEQGCKPVRDRLPFWSLG